MSGNGFIVHSVPIRSWSAVMKVGAIIVIIPKKKPPVYFTAVFYCSLFQNLQLIAWKEGDQTYNTYRRGKEQGPKREIGLLNQSPFALIIVSPLSEKYMLLPVMMRVSCCAFSGSASLFIVTKIICVLKGESW